LLFYKQNKEEKKNRKSQIINEVQKWMWKEVENKIERRRKKKKYRKQQRRK
jgi:hypothetical protein